MFWEGNLGVNCIIMRKSEFWSCYLGLRLNVMLMGCWFLSGTLCAAGNCRQPIEGSCILTQGPNPQRYHPGHLRCDHRGGVSGAQTCRKNMDEYYEVGGGRYCERHVGEVLRNQGGDGGLGGRNFRAEKRRTRLVDLPVGGF
jgi:hypothetical protein